MEEKEGNVTLKTINKVLEALRLAKEPQSVFAISKLEQLNYNSVTNALNYLEKEGKISPVKTSSGTFWQVCENAKQ